MRAIIFDLDGTLVDSMGYWRSVTRDFMKEKGIVVENHVQHKMTTMSLNTSLRYLKDYYNLSESFEELYAGFSSTVKDFYANKVDLKDNALEILKYFKDGNKKIVIGTSTAKTFADIIIKKYGMDKYIEGLYTADSVGHIKADEKFFTTITSELKEEAKDVLLVDDSYIALRTAKSAGLETVGIYDENSKDTWQKIVDENKYSITNLIELKNI